MISHPTPGQSVQLWYNPRLARYARLHGKVGTVVVRARRSPRNHGVVVDGVLYVVPAGQLRKPTEI